MEENRYYKALQNHPFSLTDEEVSDKVDKLIAEKFVVNNTGEVWKLLYSCIDLTTLNSTDTKEEVWRFTEKVNDFDGSNPEIENVAAICVYPNLVGKSERGLNGRCTHCRGVRRLSCVTNIYRGKIAETALAVANGADEIEHRT